MKGSKSSKTTKKGRGANGLPWLRRDRNQFYVTDPVTGRKSASLTATGTSCGGTKARRKVKTRTGRTQSGTNHSGSDKRA